jgi:hypothetical protein
MAEFRECGLCGAAMADPERHSNWHKSVDGEIDKLKRWVKEAERVIGRLL